MAIWICCSECGSRDVMRDATARWDDDAQEWDLNVVFDNSDCNDCATARSLEEVTLVTDADIPEAIREFGWVIIDTGLAKTPHGVKPDRDTPLYTSFETLADAYCWARANDRT